MYFYVRIQRNRQLRRTDAIMILLKLIRESFLFAFQAIVANKLRTLLSLLGITIGIFAVITVFTIVDSMENSIRKNIESLGDDVLFVQKWPWEFSNDFPWWKYINRPVPTLDEMEEIEKRLNGAQAVSFMISTGKTIKFNERSIDNVGVLCVSKDYANTMTLNIAEGRYFTTSESVAGRAVVIIGANIATNFFENTDPIGKEIKVFGRKLQVVGVLKKEGEDMFGGSGDNQVIIPVTYIRNVVDIKWEGFDPLIIVKAKEGVSNAQLKDELKGIMRSIRKLKPGAEDNFSINETSLLIKGFEEIFKVLSLAGWVIGGFSLLVGGFGIANIMFVSVRERTNIIGIQKSLGAKNYFILLQFLFEAVILSLIGGIFGLIIVWLGTLVVRYGLDFDLTLTLGNIVLGVTVSFFIGLIAGALPAWSASRLDPVVAIRSGG
jgi:putative ABC transport system permease protein